MILAPPGAKIKRAAFTLLELLVVISLIAVLTGIVIGVGRRAIRSGQAARARTELAALSVALETYRQTHGDYPRTDDSARLLQSLLGRRGPGNDVINTPPLLDPARWTTAAARDAFTDPAAQLSDPWNQPYRYAYRSVVPWTNSGYVLYSTGPDGRDFPRLLAGGFPDTTATDNVDNLHANR